MILKKTLKCIEMTPKYSPILWWPQKIIHKIFIPKKISIFRKTPKNIEIQNFEPQKMARAYVCMRISEYPPPPPGLYSRHTVMPWITIHPPAPPPPPEIFLIGIVCLLMLQIPRTQRILAHSSFSLWPSKYCVRDLVMQSCKNTAKSVFFTQNFKIRNLWLDVQNWASQ